PRPRRLASRRATSSSPSTTRRSARRRSSPAASSGPRPARASRSRFCARARRSSCLSSWAAFPKSADRRRLLEGTPERSVGAVSSGDGTLAATLDGLARRGFTEHFEAAADGLRAAEGGRTFKAAELVIRELHRFEGVSDPDDMSIVYAIESRDGTRGTLVDAFGVYSDPAVSRVLEDV